MKISPPPTPNKPPKMPEPPRFRLHSKIGVGALMGKRLLVGGLVPGAALIGVIVGGLLWTAQWRVPEDLRFVARIVRFLNGNWRCRHACCACDALRATTFGVGRHRNEPWLPCRASVRERGCSS